MRPKPAPAADAGEGAAFELDAEVLKGDAWVALPGTAPVPVEQHREGQCRWPIGEPAEAGFGYCGCPVATGSAYCRTHQARAAGRATELARKFKVPSKADRRFAGVS